MRKTILAGLALLSLGASEARAAAPDTSRVAGMPTGEAAFLVDDGRYADPVDQDSYREGQYSPSVRVWLDDDRDVLRPGDRARVLVRTTEDAYVAVLHIDTNGDVEFLYPASPNDDGYLRGGRTYAVPGRASGYLSTQGGYGIGYVFAVSSTEPLDLGRFRDSWYRSTHWDRSRNVYGDPFHAMERFERDLVPDWDYGYHDSDYYSYHVGRRYTYPRYACYEDYGSWYYSRATSWNSCDRVRVLLVRVPYYYDTRYYRGDRRSYYHRYYASYYERYDRYDRYDRRDRQPEHGYKDRGQVTSAPPLRRQGAQDVGVRMAGDQEGRGQQEPRARQPERSRPTFGRRTTESAEPSRREPQERRASPPAGRRAEPQERRAAPPAERRAEPRRESAPRSEPRRESAPRSEPRRESAPRRESPPPRASSSSGRSSGSSRRPN